MSRNTQFLTPGRQKLAENPKLRGDGVVGAVPFLNPTRARFNLTPQEAAAIEQEAVKPNTKASTATTPSSSAAAATPLTDAQLEWRSRDNRKGRHILVVPRTHAKQDVPELTSSWRAVAKGIWRMCTVFAWWDVSWWIAMLFSVGSAIFVASGLIYWLPLVDASLGFKGDALAGGICAFVGATLFQVGAILLMVEAVNENQTGCFGWAVDQLFTHDSQDDSEGNGHGNGNAKLPSTSIARHKGGFVHCTHHHAHGLHRSAHLQHPDSQRKWEWWPTWEELRTHYLREIGFLASAWLSLGATIFYVSGIMALPQIYDSLSKGVLDGVYWLAYLLGGVLFVVSSALYMLETQTAWWKPAPHVLGWWIGTWNMIGSVGWTLSASFGYCSTHWCSFQSNLSLTWASLAFLIGSLLLWYESLNKSVVIRAKK